MTQVGDKWFVQRKKGKEKYIWGGLGQANFPLSNEFLYQHYVPT